MRKGHLPALSPDVVELLDRLRKAMTAVWQSQHIKPAWLGRGRLRGSIARAQEALTSIRDLGEWIAIPSLLYVLASDIETLRNHAAYVVDHLVSRIPASQLPAFERRLRESTYKTYLWHEQGMSAVTGRIWPPHVWALLTMHASGFVREAAMKKLLLLGDYELALPFLLLRLNDWVIQVRSIAEDIVRGLVNSRSMHLWVPVLGLLPRLQDRSRADHAWLQDRLFRLFAIRKNRRFLLLAAGSSETATVRWAARAMLTLPRSERNMLVWSLVDHPDAVVRLNVARALRDGKPSAARDQLFEHLASDPSMLVRREVLLARLEDSGADRDEILRAALVDRHASIREAARYYLRKDAEGCGAAFDSRNYYLEKRESVELRTLPQVILGLGECGECEDANIAAPYVEMADVRVAKAAVRACGALDRKSRLLWFARLLTDARPGVARAAARELITAGDAAPVGQLREILRSAPHSHSRRYALRILLRMHLFDAMIDAIRALDGPDVDIIQMGSEFINNAHSWRVPYGPSDPQKAAVVDALRSLSQPPSDSIRRRLHALMGIETNRAS